MTDDEAASPPTPPVDIATDRPTPARMYDYFLGGKDNFAVDREAAENVIATMPDGFVRGVARENRMFLERAVSHLARQGVEQFIDVGSGLPTQRNTHQIAQEVDPGARVVYVDNDPIVLAHGRALLVENDRTAVVTADMREPQAIMDSAEVRRLIDFDRPVAVLFVAVFNFVTEEEDPHRIIEPFVERMVPDSRLVVTHVTDEYASKEKVDEFRGAYTASSLTFRTFAQVKRMFDGFEPEGRPEIVHCWQWPSEAPPPHSTWTAAGVGRKIA